MYHQFMELRVVWCVVVALWLARLSPVLASGFGKCPNYPSMPKFNMTKVRTNGPNPSSSSPTLLALELFLASCWHALLEGVQ